MPISWLKSRRVIFIAFSAIFVATVINSFVFVAAALYLGGDALSGKIENGRYYLNSHGHYTEVSAQIFRYSEVHARSVAVSMPLAILIGIFLTQGRAHKSGGFRPKRPQQPGGA